MILDVRIFIHMSRGGDEQE